MKIKNAFVVGVLVLVFGNTQAATLDQSFENVLLPDGQMYMAAMGGNFRAQTFTAGLNGYLTSIEVPIFQAYVDGYTRPIQVAIFGTDSLGAPDPTKNLSSWLVFNNTSLPPQSSFVRGTQPAFTHFDFLPTQPATVAAGTKYAIVFGYDPNSPTGSGGLVWGYSETPGQQYLGGSMAFSWDNAVGSWSEQEGRSAGFRTYVEATPIPEPATYAMLLAGLGLLGLTARHRKLNT